MVAGRDRHIWIRDDKGKVTSLAVPSDVELDAASSACPVSMTADGRTIIVSGLREFVMLDRATGAVERRVNHDVQMCETIAISGDGKTFATAAFRGPIRIFDTLSGRKLRELGNYDDFLDAVAYFPDNASIVVGGRQKSLIIWDSSTGVVKRQFNECRDKVRSVAVSPDGQTIAVGGYLRHPPDRHSDGFVDLYDISSGRRTCEFDVDNVVLGLRFSRDGRFVAAFCGGNVVILLEPSRKAKRSLEPHEDNFNAIAFSPSKNVLSAGTLDGSIQDWDLDEKERSKR
jgi:WD40 repeat protein